MKLFPVLLAGSIAANLALAVALLRWTPQTSAPAGAHLATDRAVARDATTAAPAHSGAPTADSVATKAWDRLRTDDVAAFAARLRAAGFPPAMITAIIRAHVSESFAARRREVIATSEKPYWMARPDLPTDPKVEKGLIALEREERDLLQPLLGSDALEGYSTSIRQVFGRELSPEKIEGYQAIQQHFSDALAKLSSPGMYLPENWAKVQELYDARHAELVKLLTPDEFLGYELRNSNAASQLRRDLGALDASEEDFRALFPLYQAIDAQFPPKPGERTPEEVARWQPVNQQLQEQIKARLGPERYAGFEQAKNYDYQQTAKITERLELPSTATAQVYAVQTDIEQRARAVRNDRTLSAADRTAQLTDLAAEANTKISGVLGGPGLEAYHEYAGRWLTNLTPRPRAAAPSPKD